MGMFDWLKVQYPLPDSEVQDKTFQTKSLENLMNSYIISEDGLLKEEYYEYDWIEGNQKSNSWIDKMPRMERKDETRKLISIPFTGLLEFYTEGPKSTQNKREWYEYDALFLNGKIQSLVRK